MEPDRNDAQEQEHFDKNRLKYYVARKHEPSKNTLKINTSRSRGELKLLKQIISDHAPKWTEVFK